VDLEVVKVYPAAHQLGVKLAGAAHAVCFGDVFSQKARGAVVLFAAVVITVHAYGHLVAAHAPQQGLHHALHVEAVCVGVFRAFPYLRVVHVHAPAVALQRYGQRLGGPSQKGVVELAQGREVWVKLRRVLHVEFDVMDFHRSYPPDYFFLAICRKELYHIMVQSTCFVN
jgi:hypothetical protein